MNHLKKPKNSKTYRKIIISIDEKILFDLMLLAHEKDITLNQLVNIILKDTMQRMEKGVKNGNWNLYLSKQGSR